MQNVCPRIYNKCPAIYIHIYTLYLRVAGAKSSAPRRAEFHLNFPLFSRLFFSLSLSLAFFPYFFLFYTYSNASEATFVVCAKARFLLIASYFLRYLFCEADSVYLGGACASSISRVRCDRIMNSKGILHWLGKQKKRYRNRVGGQRDTAGKSGVVL